MYVMSAEKGLFARCDREHCGESVFLRPVGDTRDNRIEEKPEGWEAIPSFGLLCPRCSKDAKELINKFMEG